jgi:hypothetical protein
MPSGIRQGAVKTTAGFLFSEPQGGSKVTLAEIFTHSILRCRVVKAASLHTRVWVVWLSACFDGFCPWFYLGRHGEQLAGIKAFALA